MATLKVSSQSQLEAAVKNVRSGDTISLAQGTYDGFTANKFSFAQKVTITSADPRKPAVINEFLLRSAANVEFKDLTFDYNPSKSSSNPFWIEGSRNIGFVNIDIEGHIKGQYGDGVGLRIKNSNSVTLRDSEISDFRNGLYASNSTNVDILNNDLHGMSNDGMLLAGMKDVVIAGNDFHDMKSPPNLKHKDAIQFMTSKSEPGSQDVVIRDNVIVNKEISHGIFLTNTLFNAGNVNAYHRDILIEDNLVRTNQVHGISVNHGDGVTIRDNVVQQIPGGSNIPLINVSMYSRDVLIQGNKVASVPDPQNSTWKVIGNETSGKDRMHWYADSNSPKVSSSKLAAAAAATTSTDEGKAAEAKGAAADDSGDVQVIDGVRSGGGETFRIGGRMLDDGTTHFLVKDIDLSDDMIIFSKFDRDTFHDKRGGNLVSTWDNGASVKLNAILDFQELVQESPDVSATTKGDQLTLEIEHKDGVAEVVFAGLGSEFRAADHPELF